MGAFSACQFTIMGEAFIVAAVDEGFGGSRAVIP
jgi:hypothetical protein